MLERRIEEASLNSWPVLQQMHFDGWIIRFSNGYTRRANSITPLYPSLLSAQEKLATCEKLYHQKQLPTTFRLLSFSSTCHDLDILLAQHGYHQHVDHVLILSTDLVQAQTTQNTALYNVPLAEWLALFCQFKQAPIEQHLQHHEMLKRIIPDPLRAVLYHAGLPVACGLGVLENDVFGLFDIVTDPQQRNKGYGTQLVTAMLDRASQNGARHAYLQVVNTNQVALHLYTKLSFHELYHYWYRIQPM